jgi:hypothetical protein
MKRITSLLTGIAVVTMLAPVPAIAQHDQAGLVNVAIGDVTTGDILSNIEVNLGVGLNLAANVCGVAVSVLAQQIGSGVARCENAEQFAEVTRLGR